MKKPPSDYKFLAPDEVEQQQLNEPEQAEFTTANHLPYNLERGKILIRDFAKNAPHKPGCYRMFNKDGKLLYVGKAKNLHKRILSYANPDKQSSRILRMIAETADMSLTITHTEMEALLLESNLIKEQSPYYNILLKDDKTMPCLLIKRDHDFPRMVKHRGAQNAKGDYFGPFPSTRAVNRALADLQKIFRLRDCSDHMFDKHHKQPCLRYQIKRCSGPCANLISKPDYEASIALLKNFLSGNHEQVRHNLQQEMQDASEQMDYEQAAYKRDQLTDLAKITSFQRINLSGMQDVDVIALHLVGGKSCVTVFFYRGGCLLGHRNYFPRHASDAEAQEIIESFLGQLYVQHNPPPLILLNIMPHDIDFISDLLEARRQGKIEISIPVRGERKKLIEHALDNAKQALEIKAAQQNTWLSALTLLQEKLQLEKLPARIEIYDNSHIQGSDAASAMVVAGTDGFVKQAYRKFHIKQVNTSLGGDDYAMMQEIMLRRFTRYKNAEKHWAVHPDILLIDGGKGQVSVVHQVIQQLQIDNIFLLGIAKGKDRNAGQETFCLADGTQFTLPDNDPLLFFLQRLRDEAHRYALGAHREKRNKHHFENPLDDIEGIGATRKRQLLQHFGSAKEIGNAALEDLQNVSGISKQMAQKIYDYFQN